MTEAYSGVGRTTRRTGVPAADVEGRRTGSAATGVERLTAGEAAGLAREWRGLAGRAAEGNVFFDPDFLLPAIAHLDGDPQIAVVRDAKGGLIGLAPVIGTRLGRIAPAVRIWTNPYAPLGVPLIDAAAIGEAVAGLVDRLAGSGSLIVPDLPLDGPVATAFRDHAGRSGRQVAVLEQRQRAILGRTVAAEDVRSSLATRRRKELGRQMRRMADLGAVAVETTVEPDCVRARFEEFLRLEAAGWKGQRGTALASASATAEFAREVVFNLSENGAVRIDSIRLDKHPVAVLTSFVSGGTAFTWKIAYDEAFARFSPGAQLMLEAGQTLFKDAAVGEIDSCAAANHPMIDHLWRERREIGTLVIGPPGDGVIHRIGLAAMKAEIEARDAAKRLRSRLMAKH